MNCAAESRPETQAIMASPFDLSETEAYALWRQRKLDACPVDVAQLLVTIQDPYVLQAEERLAMIASCRRYNMVLYQLSNPQQQQKTLVHELGRQLGLVRLDTNLRADEDSVTSLENRAQSGNQYIPYTNKPLSWHTDGYYNTMEHQVKAIIMHCVSAADSGGENTLLDHELMYIRLRDEDPEYITALMHPEAMTIPANIEAGTELRGARTGPVFSVDPATGCLHMRYSARKHNIEWREHEKTHEAAAVITELLTDDSMVLSYRLESGQGIICNNVLHKRSGFDDSERQRRLMYRARYFDRIAETGLSPGDDRCSG